MAEAPGADALPDIDTIRSRWRCWRGRQRLVDPENEEFGQGGLARLITDKTSRLVILPRDPEAHSVEFSDELWAWWGSDSEDPATGGQTNWAIHKRPTAGAAVCGGDYGESGWDRYLALHRSGALEVGFGRDGSFARDESAPRRFFLSSIVARCWAAIVRYREVIERFSLQPPHELSLALVGTGGAFLGGFAEGWAEPGRAGHSASACPDANVLIRRECIAWPESGDEARVLAFGLGAQIEDAWGVRQRRFLANRGRFEGEFDPRPAAWH